MVVSYNHSTHHFRIVSMRSMRMLIIRNLSVIVRKNTQKYVKIRIRTHFQFSEINFFLKKSGAYLNRITSYWKSIRSVPMQTIRDRIIPQLYGFFFNAYYTHMLGFTIEIWTHRFNFFGPCLD